VIESLQCAGNVAGHWEINVVLFIVPVECEADVMVASPILGTFVFLVNDGNEVVNVLFASVSDAKIVNDQGEHEAALEMYPRAGGHRAWYIAKQGKEFAESVVGKLAGLWEGIRAFAHLSILDSSWYNATMAGNQHMRGDADIFIIREVTSEIEIFQI
jgi:hypothetical protein